MHAEQDRRVLNRDLLKPAAAVSLAAAHTQDESERDSDGDIRAEGRPHRKQQ
jgi:hypothetical protein